MQTASRRAGEPPLARRRRLLLATNCLALGLFGLQLLLLASSSGEAASLLALQQAQNGATKMAIRDRG